MKYYKLVTPGKESLNISIYRSIGVIYGVDHWVYPKLQGSKLCVFNCLKRALKEQQSYECDLYECEVKNPSKAHIYRAGTNDNLMKYWDVVAAARKKKASINNALRAANYINVFPENTVFCNAIKLTKLIQ